MPFNKSFLLLLSFGLICTTVSAQIKVPSFDNILKGTGERSLIKNIVISGNKKTREEVVIREMGFGIGDSLPVTNISQVIDRIKLNLLNTKLFTDVQINIKNWDNDGLEIHLQVVEKWYIIPIPIFQLADRNLNEWWVDRNRDFKRIQYGVSLNWANFRGRNENLTVSASLGFAQLLGFNYYMPNLSKNGKIGASFNVQMMQSKRMAYDTYQDKLRFVYEDRIIKRSIDIAPRLILHRNINIQHYIEGRFSYRWVDKKVSELNQDYFLNGANTQSAIALEYGFNIDKRTLRAYPTSGYQVKGTLTNYGMGLQRQVNMTTLTLAASKFFTLDKYGKHSTGHYVKVKGSYPKKQPYNLQSGLGYGQDFVRGYEYYVVDGQSYTLVKNEYRYQFASWRLAMNSKKANAAIKQTFPFDFFVKAYIDAGYVDDNYFTRNNTLHNQWLVGGGIGIDMLILYDKLIRIEYSVNKSKQHGLYLHLELPF